MKDVVFARIELPCGHFDALHATHFKRRFRPHFHETFAIGVIEAGCARLETARGVWQGGPGTILCFSPGEVHSADPIDDEGFSYRMYYPSSEMMRELGIRVESDDAAPPLFERPVIDDPALAERLSETHVLLLEGRQSPSAEARVVNSMRALVQRHRAAADARSHSPRDLAAVLQARDYLRRHFTQQVSIVALAQSAGLSPFHFIRLFHRVLGMPPYAYLVQLRVNRARIMLCRGWSVAQVSYACGFSDQSHLTRLFHSSVGVPPGQYLRSTRPAA